MGMRRCTGETVDAKRRLGITRRDKTIPREQSVEIEQSRPQQEGHAYVVNAIPPNAAAPDNICRTGNIDHTDSSPQHYKYCSKELKW